MIHTQIWLAETVDVSFHLKRNADGRIQPLLDGPLTEVGLH